MASTTEVDRSSVPPASSWTTSALSPSTRPTARRTARRGARLPPGPAHRPGGAGGGPLRGGPLPLAGRPRLGREPCLAGGAGRADGRAAGGPARAGRADRGTDGHRPGEQPHLAGGAPLLPAARTRRGACNADHVGAG